MKAITLTQPWASLVAIGEKGWETRAWGTEYRGPLAIHAAKGLGAVHGRRGLRQLCGRWPYAPALENAGLTADDLPLGAVVAVCELTACLPASDVPSAERTFGWFAEGRFAWRLDTVVAVDPPIPLGGKLSLFAVPRSLSRELTALLAEAQPRQEVLFA